MVGKWLFLLLLFPSLFCCGQVITTFAGNGIMGSPLEGASATSTSIGEPDGCAFDTYGNFYFTQVVPDRVFKISPSGSITSIAGTSSTGYNGDGIMATTAKLDIPAGIAIDSANNIFIADGNNNRVRKVDAITGVITTIAGTGSAGFSGDGGPASAAVFNGVADICFDKRGNLYISDIGNHRLRKINPFGIVSTFAGTGVGGYTGDGGQATAAQIISINGIAIDKSGNLYLAQSNSGVVRKINPTGIISTIAGNGMVGPSGDEGPATAAALAPVRLAVDNFGDLYISCWINYNVRLIDKNGIIHTVAGTGISGFSGDNGLAKTAQLSSTFGITLDTCGNVYLSDKNNSRIRKITYPHCNYLAIENSRLPSTNITINPNPTYDQLNINPESPSTYRLINILGTTTQQGTLKAGDNTISIKALPTGMYMLVLTDEERNRTVTKIIKQ
jgi:hypothetical protein